tara:strand:- start:6488 stop:6976 length:489 start_codon:yes stop_codon:yes gene_type:complete
MRSKRAELTTEEIIKLILSIAGVFLIILLLYNLIAPTFDKEDETARSYFKNLKKQIKIADSGGIGEFFMWSIEEKTKYYLVYFGEKISFSDKVGGKEKTFIYGGDREKGICVCSSLEKGFVNCNYCVDLDFPVNEMTSEVLGESGHKFFISKGEDSYEIKAI